MKKLIGLFFSLTAMAQTDSVMSGKYFEGRNPESVNYIKNSSCFKGVANITGTNTTVTKNTTTPLTSISDCTATLNSSSDTIDFSTATLDRSLKGGNCEVGIRYKLTLGSGNTIQLQARINSATVASADLVTSDNGTATVNFPCGDLSNAPSLRIAQTAGSSSQDINVSNVYLGAARNIGTVAQAQFVGSISWAKTTSCQWTTTQTTYAANFTADTDCDDNARTVEGSVTDSSSGQSPQFGITGMGPGYYMITVTGSLVAYDGSGTSARTEFQLSDGSQVGNEIPVATAGAAAGSGDLMGTGTNTFFVTVTTAQSPTYNIRGKTSAGSAPQAQIDVRYSQFKVSVYRFPSSSEIAVRADNGNTDWSNGLSSSFTVGGFGTTTLQSIWTRREGDSLRVRGYWKNGTSAASTAKISLPSGYTINSSKFSSTTSVQRVGFITESRTGASGNIQTWPLFYDGSDTSAVYMAYLTASDVFTKVNGSDLSASSNGLTFEMLIPITGWTNNMNAPVLVGSVTSNSTGAERVERVEFRCFSTSAINSQSGSWVSSVGNISSGACQVNIASGIFSAAPTCQVSLKVSTGTSYMYNALINSITTSAVVVQGLFISSGSAAVGNISDNVFELTCQGPR